MIKKINLTIVILSAVILLALVQLSYADYGAFTVNIPNNQGGYTAIVIKQSGQGYVGPQGEYYSSFPSVYQLQNVYGLAVPNSTVVANTNDGSYTSQTGNNISVTIAPPELPVYDQPEAPGPNYIWTPGYWAYSSFDEDYYWVPGTWVTPPQDGLLWTPGYWYWREGVFVYSEGYWGPHVGFYGGINYGHGYEGTGTSSFNGGPGGTNAKPSYSDQIAMQEKHIPPTAVQTFHVQAASQNTALMASRNHGKPAVAATIKPGILTGNGIVVAKQAGAFYNNSKPIKPVNAQQSKASPNLLSISKGGQVQQKPLPVQNKVQQSPKNQPPKTNKQQLSQKQLAALKAQQDKKKREQQLLQQQKEQQGQ